MNYNIDIYIIDLLKSDKSNELFIISDTDRIAQDMITFLRDNFDEYGFYSQLGVTNLQHISENFNDDVAGTKFTLSITIPDGNDACESIFKN